jgi:uncharacterized protein (TIGR02246 family)
MIRRLTPSSTVVAGGVLLLAAFILLPRATPPAALGADEPREPGRADDQAAVRKRTEAFLQALARGNAGEVAGFWTAAGEYMHGDDLTIRGRANIEKAYAEHLKKKQPGAVTVEGDSVRFLSDDAAVQEGAFVVKRTNPAETTRNQFSALYVRSGGNWYFGLLRESPEEPSLQELAWLVGSWTYGGDGAETRMVVEWTEDKKYLLCRTTHKQDDETTTATQILAVHPGTGAIQSWTFESDGSLGEAVWSRTDKGWTAKVTSVTADGDKVTATTILTPIDENTFTYQSTERKLAGEKAADIGPIKVTRSGKVTAK